MNHVNYHNQIVVNVRVLHYLYFVVVVIGVLSNGFVSVESILLSLLLFCKNFERSEAILLLGINVEVLFNCSSSSELILVVVVDEFLVVVD